MRCDLINIFQVFAVVGAVTAARRRNFAKAAGDLDAIVS